MSEMITETWARRDSGLLEFYQNDDKEIRDLLLGHAVAKVAEDHLRLDDGTLLRIVPNDGGCSCGAGDYDLTELNGCENVVTNVELHDETADDGYGTVYRIFVFAEDKRINLATIEGDDGNGYYGTGYSILVRPATTPTCGHPNHGNPDHDCAPFVSAESDAPPCGSCGEPGPYTITLRENPVPACLRHLNVWRTPAPDYTCPTRCVEVNHPGREHFEWLRPGGKHLTDCPVCGVTFGVSAKHMVRQRARCRACIRKSNGWTCRTCGSTDPHHPSPCPIPPAEPR